MKCLLKSILIVCRCPAGAIPPLKSGDSTELDRTGVTAEKCYGCGRCIPACPLGLVVAQTYQSRPSQVMDLLQSAEVDAIEIHTGPNHEQAFAQLWQQIGWVILASYVRKLFSLF